MWIDFFICLFFGEFGVHKFRERKICMGILYLFTVGIFGIGWFIDCIRYLIIALRGKNSGNSNIQPEHSAAISDNNLKFKQFSESSRKHLQSGEIGFYRNDLFGMASILENEGKLKNALFQYLYVFYLDCIGISSLEALKMGLTPQPCIAPGVVRRIHIIKNKLQLSEAELKNLFFSIPPESIMPNAIFSIQDIYNLLLLSLDGKNIDTNKIIQERKKSYKLSAH